MSRLFISGDCHGDVDIRKFYHSFFPIQDELTRNDVVWILGDLGACFYGEGTREDKFVQDFWEERNFTVISTIGNHENYEVIKNNLPIIRKFGGKCYQVRENLFYADNDIFNIYGKRILNVNGADSIDREYRMPNVDWWEDEQLTRCEVFQIREKLKTVNNRVDYIFSHTGGEEVCRTLGFTPTFSDRRLSEILNNCDYKKHLCAHYHLDSNINQNTRILYNDIIELI